MDYLDWHKKYDELMARQEQVAAEARRDELRHISKILQNRGVVWLAEWLKAELATLPASGQAEAKETKQ